MWVRILLAAALTYFDAAVLCAQAPLVTPAGDPSVQDDSIYALAVEPSEYRGHDVVFLLDDGIAQIERGGNTLFTVRQVVQILTPDGADSWGEFTFAYYPTRQHFRLNWIRVLSAGGTVLTEGPVQQQESRRPVEPGSAVYSDQRLVQMSLAGVASGTIVDYSYSIETFAPRLADDVWYHWSVNSLVPTLRSRFILDAPEHLALNVREANLSFTARERVENGRRVRTWATRDVSAIEPQSYAGFPNDVLMSIEVSGNLTWDEIGAWYRELAEDRYVLTPNIEADHAVQLAGARTLEDSLRATYRWVAQDFRYVSISLGEGAYQPRTPREVYESGFGDCKDKSTLFISLVRNMGVPAFPVLVDTERAANGRTPSLKQFDHMIVGVESVGRVRYFDLTDGLTPYGQLPPPLQGEVGVVIRDSATEVVRLPADQPNHNTFEEVVTGTLGRDNRFVGSVTLAASGYEQYGLRADFAGFNNLNDDERDELLRWYLQSTVWENAIIDSSTAFDGRDLDAVPRITIWFTSSDVLGVVGDRYTLNLPLSDFSDGTIVSQLEAEGVRRFPIDVAAVNSPSVYRSSFELELPEGWKAEMPDDVLVDGVFGYYRAEYRQVGRTVYVTREMGGRRGLEPADSIGALKQWFSAVANDDTRSLTINRAGSAGIIAANAAQSPGRFPSVLLSLDDLPQGADLAFEGPADSEDLLSISASTPVESYSRSFVAKQMVFTVGESQLALLRVSGAAYRSHAEATKVLGMLGVMDISALFAAYFGQIGLEQASVGRARTIDMSSVSDRAAGWVVEMVTPFATMDLAMVIFTSGRVTISGMCVGSTGLRGEDLSSLLLLMSERLQLEDEYLADLGPESWETEDDTELVVADSIEDGIPLDDILLRVEDIPGSMQSTREFSRVDGIPRFAVGVEGRGFTFATPNSEAVSLDMEVVLHSDEAHALKALLEAERQDVESFLRDLLGNEAELAGVLSAGTGSSLERIASNTVGERSLARLVRLRGVFNIDVAAFAFLRGRFLISVSVVSMPDQAVPGDAVTFAAQIDDRLLQTVPDLAGRSSPGGELLNAVQEVVLAENAVDSLVEARDFDAMFAELDRSHLERAPASFGADTWNSICWYASLYGYAERAMPACEATVAPDSTNLARRDSRAVARALVGDTDGAIADFTYIVDHAPEGAFLDMRAGWLDVLKAGGNPFTEKELLRLRGEEEGG
jgi:hypothetical protein